MVLERLLVFFLWVPRDFPSKDFWLWMSPTDTLLPYFWTNTGLGGNELYVTIRFSFDALDPLEISSALLSVCTTLN